MTLIEIDYIAFSEFILSSIAGVVSYFIWKNKNFPGSVPLFISCIGVLFYGYLSAMTTFLFYDSLVIIFAYLMYSIVSIIAASSFYLSLEYTDNKLNRTSTIIYLSIYILITFFIFITNSYHNILIENMYVSNSVLIIDVTIYYIFIYFIPILFLINTSIVFLIINAFSSKVHRYQSLVIAFGLFTGQVFSFINILIGSSPENFNLNIIGLISAVLIVFYGLNVNTFDTVPFNRETILEEIDQTIILINSSNIIMDISSADEYLGISENIIGLKSSDFLDSSDFNKLVNSDKDGEIELEIPSDSGKKRYYRISKYKIKRSCTLFSNDPYVGSVILFKDITVRKRQTHNINLLKNVYCRVLRHNIRNEINVISGNAELLSTNEEYNKDNVDMIIKKSEDIVDISEKVRYAEDVIENYNDLYDHELYTLLNNVKSEVISNYSDSHIYINININKFVKVRANGALNIALVEIIENSVKHNSDNCVVNITETVDNNVYKLVISDNGDGIPEDEIEPLHDYNETKLHHTSSIGLWLIKLIIDESKCDIEFKSTGDGTDVIIWFYNYSIDTN